MARRKTTKAALAAIQRYNASREHFEGVLKTLERLPVENWTEHTKKWTPEVIDAYMRGFMAATEGVIFDQNCWGGFYRVDENGEFLNFDGHLLIEDNPKYRDWRVKFIVRG